MANERQSNPAEEVASLQNRIDQLIKDNPEVALAFRIEKEVRQQFSEWPEEKINALVTAVRGMSFDPELRDVYFKARDRNRAQAYERADGRSSLLHEDIDNKLSAYDLGALVKKHLPPDSPEIFGLEGFGMFTAGDAFSKIVRREMQQDPQMEELYTAHREGMDKKVSAMSAELQADPDLHAAYKMFRAKHEVDLVTGKKKFDEPFYGQLTENEYQFIGMLRQKAQEKGFDVQGGPVEVVLLQSNVLSGLAKTHDNEIAKQKEQAQGGDVEVAVPALTQTKAPAPDKARAENPPRGGFGTR